MLLDSRMYTLVFVNDKTHERRVRLYICKSVIYSVSEMTGT